MGNDRNKGGFTFRVIEGGKSIDKAEIQATEGVPHAMDSTRTGVENVIIGPKQKMYFMEQMGEARRQCEKIVEDHYAAAKEMIEDKEIRDDFVAQYEFATWRQEILRHVDGIKADIESKINATFENLEAEENTLNFNDVAEKINALMEQILEDIGKIGEYITEERLKLEDENYEYDKGTSTSPFSDGVPLSQPNVDGLLDKFKPKKAGVFNILFEANFYLNLEKNSDKEYYIMSIYILCSHCFL